MGIRLSPKADSTYYLNVLREAADVSNGKFDVFTHSTMPQQHPGHFAYNDCIAPIWFIPKVGYALTDTEENSKGTSKGNHGYDSEDVTMHAMFVAHCPFSSVVKMLHHARSESSANILARWLPLSRPNKGWHSISDDTYVMDTFLNVEIYNLMMKLLVIERYAAHMNGTVFLAFSFVQLFPVDSLWIDCVYVALSLLLLRIFMFRFISR